MPLTLPSPRLRGEGKLALSEPRISFSPRAGRRCRQADEGRASAAINRRSARSTSGSASPTWSGRDHNAA
ncbi:hypothetical protein D4A92_01995 [Rhizobium rosettiformans]|uniref:Uncharacterized protein n=1 Tax=Rhizobium rosettiformans TaxID=1368430 RepID=A0ABX7EQQ3_9HYPH|nr:hypothetical protein D4A92_01995 [Rhizobium rosettiformans]